MVRFSLVLVVSLVTGSFLPAATWAEALFDDLKKDFGSVQRGPALQHHFRVTNNSKNVVTISSVRVSCGCLTVVAQKGQLQPGESTTLHASMDTGRFIGFRAVTVFVQFSTPAFEEVRLVVQANARTDFAISPDSLAFGQVTRGTSGTASVTLTFYGHREAQVLKVKSDTNYVTPSVVETRRLDHEVVFTITAKLREDTPVGKWYTDVWLESSVLGLNQIRVPVTVEVLPALTVTPPLLSLGAVKVGAEGGGKVLVRGATPFKITAIKGAGDGVNVTHDDKEREVHIINIKTLVGTAGKLDRTLTIVTNLKTDNEVQIKLDGAIQP